jgi:hypothetical protein
LENFKEGKMDFNLLIEALKEKGLDIAEDAAKLVVVEVLNFVEKQVIASENKYDDLLLAVLPTVKTLILAQIDKIDGEIETPEDPKPEAA